MMHRTIRACLVIVCAFFVVGVHAQNQRKADSLLSLIESRDLSPGDEMTAYHLLSGYSSSPEDELKYGIELLRLAKKYNSTEFIVKANKRIGIAHRLMGNLGKALEYLFESANAAANQEELEPQLADIYTEISTCYTQNGDADNALHYGLKAVEILRKPGRKSELGTSLINMGYDYFVIGQYDSAMAYYNEAEPIVTESKKPIELAYLIGNRALVYWKQGHAKKAKKDLNQAIEMLESLDDRYGISDYYNQLAHIHLEENNPTKAIDYLLKSLALAKREGFKEQARDASHLLVQAYLQTDELKKAMDYQNQYYAYKDSIQNLETTQRIANLRTGFEVGQKQAEVDLLLEQKRSNQIIIITGGIILLIVICLALVIYFYLKSTRKLNRQLEEQKKDLITLNNTKDKFFSIISHDLRGPVNVLNGFIHLIKYRRDQTAEELQNMLNRMENSAGNLIKLLDNLLYWALQQKGDFPYSPQNHSIRSILTDVVELFQPVTESKKIQLQLEIPQDFGVFVDRNSTSTIFRNLLSNATKFTHEGGHITISAAKSPDNQFGEITVTDSGVGISEKKLNRLFVLREDISTKGTHGESGIGLGLQLVFEFVHFNKGEISVESVEGTGTTFTILLPLGEENII